MNFHPGGHPEARFCCPPLAGFSCKGVLAPGLVSNYVITRYVRIRVQLLLGIPNISDLATQSLSPSNNHLADPPTPTTLDPDPNPDCQPIPISYIAPHMQPRKLSRVYAYAKAALRSSFQHPLIDVISQTAKSSNSAVQGRHFQRWPHCF